MNIYIFKDYEDLKVMKLKFCFLIPSPGCSLCGTLGIIHVLEELHGPCEGHHLRPATQGHLAEGREAVGHVAELQTQTGRQITCFKRADKKNWVGDGFGDDQSISTYSIYQNVWSFL